MVDLKELRENPAKFRDGAAKKNMPVDIEAVLAADAARVTALQAFEAARARQNEASKSIGQLKDPEAKKAAIAQVATLKSEVQQLEDLAKAAEAALEPLLLKIPQPPDDDVPVGKEAADNVVIEVVGTPPAFGFKPLNHIELLARHKAVDFDAGVRIAGSRSYFLKGLGAQLHNAVMQLAIDLMTRKHGFTLMTVPVMVRESALIGTGFFPAGKEQTYAVTADEVYLTGTAEVGLTAYHMNEVLTEADLPLKYTAISTCFRREAGTYGKDTAGLYRVHQFDKCEQVVICKNDVTESRKWHAAMMGYSKELLAALEVPYRVIQCCTGDIGVKNAAMFDIESWMPGRFDGKDTNTGYGETHSASRLYEFQARRLNLRYKDSTGKIHFCHTLNNTVVASPRVLIPLVENHQQADGSINIPKALRPYLGGLEVAKIA
jgi:seryl-tRNA synthetase